MWGSEEPTGPLLEMVSIPRAPHSLPVLLLRHPQAEGLQHPPQLVRLHPARPVHVDEVEGAHHGFDVLRDLRGKAMEGRSEDPGLQTKMATSNVNALNASCRTRSRARSHRCCRTAREGEEDTAFMERCQGNVLCNRSR